MDAIPMDGGRGCGWMDAIPMDGGRGVDGWQWEGGMPSPWMEGIVCDGTDAGGAVPRLTWEITMETDTWDGASANAPNKTLATEGTTVEEQHGEPERVQGQARG
eukprot:scaffold840_cov344-Pavlova_lutheri.AAC.73